MSVGQVNYSYGSGGPSSYFYVVPATELQASGEVVVWSQYHLLCADGSLGVRGVQKVLEASLQDLMEGNGSGDGADGDGGAQENGKAGKGSGGGRAMQLLAEFEQRSAEEVSVWTLPLFFLSFLSHLHRSMPIFLRCRFGGMSNESCRRWTRRQRHNCARYLSINA